MNQKILFTGSVATLLILAAPGARAGDTTCKGAQGDHATPPGSTGGVPLPAKRSCLNPEVAKLVDGNKEDFVAGMAIDSQGNAIIAGETKSFDDTFYGDIFVAKLSPKGELAWMVTYGGKQDDGIHAHDENSEGYGQEAMIDVDEKDNIYVVGRGKSHQRIYGGLAMKLNPKGELQWVESYRPNWMNRASSAAEFHAVDYQKGVLHIVGVTEGESKALLVAVKADDGSLIARAAVDPNAGYNDRFYSVAASEAGDAVYTGGWLGQGGPGSLMKFKFDGKKYELDWARAITLPRGSNIPSIDVVGDAIFAVADIHGGKTHAEVHRYETSQGKLVWARRYNAGVSNDKTQTNVVKAFGDHLVLAGKIGFTGTHTHIDSFGDGFFLLLDEDGNLKKEHYFFTGTNPKSFDSIMAVGAHGKNLYLVGNHFGTAMVGEWRYPADYDEIAHAWAEGDKREYMPKKISPAVDTNFKADELKDAKTLEEYAFNAEAGDYAYVEPITKETKARSAQIFFWVFEGYLP